MFYFATLHSNRDYILKELLKEIDPEKQMYLVTEEISKTSHQDISGQHFHIIAQMEDKNYTNYSKRVITKLGLRGKADLGLSRQYGKVKIKDLDKAISYVLKDNGKYHTNMTAEQIQEFYDKSFKKDDTRDIRRQIINSLIQQYDITQRWMELQDELHYGSYDKHLEAFDNWSCSVVGHMIDANAPVTSKTQIENIIKQFIQESKTLGKSQKIRLLLSINNIKNPYRYI